MTGTALADIMRIPGLVDALFAAARRYTACLQDQEEYVQEGWLRIAKECEDDDQPREMVEEAKRAMNAFRMRKIRAVHKKTGINVHGKGKESKLKPGLKHLYRNKYVKVTPEKLDSWYYEPEWEELGLERTDCSIRLWHQIISEES